MTARVKRVVAAVLMAACFCAVSACRNSIRPRDYSAERSDPGDLVGGIEAMKHDYMEAKALGIENGDMKVDIPPRYFTAAIRAFNPMRVYCVGTDVMVVQTSADGIDSGKLLVLPYSSMMYLNTNGAPLSGYWTNGVRVYDFKNSQPVH